MLPITLLLALFPALFSVTAAQPLHEISARESNATALEPWKLRALHTHSPSGRPGNDPHSTLFFTIHDPNTIDAAPTPTGEAVFPPSTANCTTQWLTSKDVPYGVETPCTAIDYGEWSFTLTKPADSDGYSPVEYFGLDFKLVDKVTVPGQTVTKKFTASDVFKVGTNLGGTCGGSGVCNWYLKNTPYDVHQTEQT